jgi:hypothetical protein
LPTPVARSPLNVYEGIAPDDLNQLLATHAPVVIYDNVTALIGAALTANTAPEFQYYQELVSPSGQPVSIDQPITMSGTILDRVELPLSVMSGVGQDVLVGLYADSAGVPTGLPLAQTYVPRELIPIAGTSLPGHGLIMSEAWTAQSSLTPPAPYDTYQVPGFVSDGVVAIFVGGQIKTGGFTATTGTVIGLMSSANGSVTQWAAGPAYPVALAEVGMAVDAQSYVYGAGGLTGAGAASNVVYSALYSSSPPTIGAWQAQTVLPQTLTNNAMIVISSGTAAGSTPILYSVGGLHSGTPGTKVVYAAPITSPGLVGAWTTPAASQFPINILQTTLVQINGYLVAIGGQTDNSLPTYTTNVWAAPINNDNTIGSWRPWPSLPAAYAGQATVYGNTILFCQENQAFSLDVSAAGQPDPIWQNCSQQWTAISGSIQAVPMMCMAGNYLVNFSADPNALLAAPGSTPLNFTSMMSVPLHVTGLSNATKYHITMSPLGNCDQFNVTQVAMSSTAPTAAYAAGLGETGPSAGFVSGVNILPSYMGTAVSRGWDAGSGRDTANVNTTYAGSVITMTSIQAAAMAISTLNTLQETGYLIAGEPDITGQYSIPVIPGVSYSFTATYKAPGATATVIPVLQFGDANGNNLSTLGSASGTDSAGGIVLTATATAPANAAFAALAVNTFSGTAGEVHTVSNISLTQNFGYVPLSLFVSGKNLKPVHVLDDIVATQPFGWNWITYDYSGKPLQIAECILPRVNLIAPNDSNMGGPVAGTATGWTAGANTALAAVANASQPLGAPLPNTPSVPAFPVINSQQCAYELRLTNSSGGSATASATTATGTSGYAVTAGQNYTAFAYFLAATTGRTVTMQIIWYNAAGGTISTSSGTGTPDVTTGWTQVYVNAVAPALAVTAAVSISIAATATTEAHGATCVSFALDNSTANTNFLNAEDSSFEGGTTGNWAGNNNGWWLVPGATVTNDATTGYVGTHSLKVVTPGNNNFEGAALPSNVYIASPSTTYTASIWVNASLGTQLAFVMRTVTATRYNDVGAGQAFTGTGTWQQVHATVTGSVNAVFVDAVVRTELGAAVNTWWMDSIAISVANSALPQLAYFEPGSGPGGMRNLVKLNYDAATSQLVSVTPNNPLTYFGTGATATYTATGMTDTQAVWPMNGLVGQVIAAPSDLTAVSNSATTTATVLFNIGNTIILTAADWSNGQPADGSAYSIT